MQSWNFWRNSKKAASYILGQRDPYIPSMDFFHASLLTSTSCDYKLWEYISTSLLTTFIFLWSSVSLKVLLWGKGSHLAWKMLAKCFIAKHYYCLHPPFYTNNPISFTFPLWLHFQLTNHSHMMLPRNMIIY